MSRSKTAQIAFGCKKKGGCGNQWHTLALAWAMLAVNIAKAGALKRVPLRWRWQWHNVALSIRE